MTCGLHERFLKRERRERLSIAATPPEIVDTNLDVDKGNDDKHDDDDVDDRGHLGEIGHGRDHQPGAMSSSAAMDSSVETSPSARPSVEAAIPSPPSVAEEKEKLNATRDKMDSNTDVDIANSAENNSWSDPNRTRVDKHGNHDEAATTSSTVSGAPTHESGLRREVDGDPAFADKKDRLEDKRSGDRKTHQGVGDPERTVLLEDVKLPSLPASTLSDQVKSEGSEGGLFDDSDFDIDDLEEVAT